MRVNRLSCLLAFLLLAPLAAGAQNVPDDPAERARKARETEKALAELQNNVTALKADMAAARRSESEALAAVADAERAVSDHRRALTQIEERIAAEEAELARIADDQVKIEADMQRQRDALGGILRLLYARSRQAPAKLLLDPERIPKLSRTLAYGRALQRDRLARLADFAKGLAALTALTTARQTALVSLEAAKESAETESAALSAALTARETALREMRQRIGDQQQQLDAFARDERAMQRLLQQLQDIFADLPKQLDGAQPFRSLRGKLPWPVDGQATNDDQGGLLIASTAGADVRAIAHGRVAFADWLKGYGLLLIVDHGDGYMSLYGHNDALLKAEGAWVQAGDVVASVGRSGGADQPALYFELRERGRTIATRPWLRRR